LRFFNPEKTMRPTNLFSNSRRTLLAVAVLAALAGCATPPSPNTVSSTIANTPALNTFYDLASKSGLIDTLNGPGPFTVFAPTNDAFKAVPAKTMAELSQDPEKLKAVMTYHVVNGKVMAKDVKNSNVKTLNGANAALGKAGDFVTIESAAVTQADMASGNGVVHIVDGVILPPAKK
jgi:uncharacterized surface protein with fasciclin (FAS1) repeats